MSLSFKILPPNLSWDVSAPASRLEDLSFEFESEQANPLQIAEEGTPDARQKSFVLSQPARDWGVLSHRNLGKITPGFERYGDADLLSAILTLTAFGITWPPKVAPYKLRDGYAAMNVESLHFRTRLGLSEVAKLICFDCEGEFLPVGLDFSGRSRHFMTLVPVKSDSSRMARILHAAAQRYRREEGPFSDAKGERIWDVHDWEELCPDFDVHGLPQFPTVYAPGNPYVVELLRTVLPHLKKSDRVLVLGSGAGYEASVLAKQKGVYVDAVDLNPLAVVNTVASAVAAGQLEYVRSWQSDGFAQVRGRYDAVIFNAPVPFFGEERDENRFDAGGKLTRRILNEFPNHLKAGGAFYLMSLADLSRYQPEWVSHDVLSVFEENAFAIHRFRPLPAGLSMRPPADSKPVGIWQRFMTFIHRLLIQKPK